MASATVAAGRERGVFGTINVPTNSRGRRGRGEEQRERLWVSSRTNRKERWGESGAGAAKARRQSGTGGRGTNCQLGGREGCEEGRRAHRCSGAVKKNAPRNEGEEESLRPNSGRRLGRRSSVATSAAEGEGTTAKPYRKDGLPVAAAMTSACSSQEAGSSPKRPGMAQNDVAVEAKARRSGREEDAGTREDTRMACAGEGAKRSSERPVKGIEGGRRDLRKGGSFVRSLLDG